MSESKQFNPLPLLSVKPGLESSLAQISADLEEYFSRGLDGIENLRKALEELHRAVGVLRMLSLEGLAVFSKEFETVLQEMLSQQQAPTTLHRDTLRGAMLALTQYLDALADGASNTALRLFYSYQELHQLRGLESAFELDLFFPELGVDLPAEVMAVPLVPVALETVKKARAQYQRALLKWLRQENPQQSLEAMRKAVQAVMACTPQDQHRAFWWIATGLLDVLMHDGLPSELNANKLLARIDLQMKSLAENKNRDSENATTRNMQYLLARSHPVSETVDKIKQTYELSTYLPETQPLPIVESSKILEQMRERLNEAQDYLEQCTSGDTSCTSNFIQKLEELHQLSEGLDRNTLQFLCKQMHAAVTESTLADIVQQIRMELAMAMMLLSAGIERYQRLNDLFHDQVRYINQFLFNGIPLEMDEDNSMGSLSALHCKAEELEVMVPLAAEMKSNLQQVELALNLFFSDSSKRDELSSLKKLLSQVNGGLYVLSLDTARQLIAPVLQATDRYLNGVTPLPAEMHAIASAVSALENYVHGLSQGLKPDTKLVEEVLASLAAGVDAVSQDMAAAEVAAPAGMAVREGGEDAELLEVFLEEANEVLETLNEHLQVCQRNPHSRESMVIIRRGFHTLKGSGRMVGLTNLGEVAWAVEKALNKWLQDEKPATPAVLEMVGDAEVLFQHWVDKLRSGDSAVIDTTTLVAAAQRIENGIYEDVKPAESEVGKAEEPPDIVIGGITLSPVLFAIATDEAAAIIETLQKLILDLRKEAQPVIKYEFVRAAHTLAGVNRSTGFTDISDLASALESWVQELMDTEVVLDILQVNLLEQTINALADMVNSLRNKQEPKPRQDLITRLQLKKKQLSKVEIADPVQEPQLTDAMQISAGESAAPVMAVPVQEIPLQAFEPEFAEEIALEPEHAPEFSMEMPFNAAPGQEQVETQETATTAHSEAAAVPAEEAGAYADDIAQTSIPEPPSMRQETQPALPASRQVDVDAADLMPPQDLPADDIDLVAYVQRVAQEHANEPLQWQSPDDKYHDKPVPAFERPVEPAADVLSLNLDEINAELKAKAEVPQAIPEFNFDFDELARPEENSLPESAVPGMNSPHPSSEYDYLAGLSGLELPELELDAPEIVRDEAPTSSYAAPEIKVESAAMAKADDFLANLSLEMAAINEPPAIQQSKPVVPNKAEATPVQRKPVEGAENEEFASQSADGKKRVIHDDLDDQLLPIFLEEADELYPQLAEELRTWHDKISDPAEGAKVARKLQRGLHTLKGSARMAGAMRLGELTHKVEDVVDAAVNTSTYDSALLEELEGFFDRIGNALDMLRSGESFEEAVPATAPVMEQAPQVAEPEPWMPVITTAGSPLPAAPAAERKTAVQAAPEALVESAEERKESAVLRVRSDIIDDLVNEAGEISVARSRIEVELNTFKTGLMDLTGSVQGLRKLVREIEMYAEGQMQARAAALGESAEKFDPLEFDRFTRFQELTRFMNESVHDVQTVQQTLLKNLDETSAAMSAQAKLNSVLQQSLMSIRMLPFSSISQRLYRIVRQTGKELGKRANLDLFGTEIEMDRGVLEKMTAPFEHLLRNSMVHGLENADLRELKGKSPIGTIALTLRQEGNEMVFEFRDDGAGLDTVKIRKKAIEQGLIGADDIVSEEKVRLMIFEKGLSTATELSEVAGRGVGMDVVLSEIQGLGGRIEVSSERDKGVRFMIYLPLTLAVMKALMVRAGNDTYAIPSVMVEQVQQVKPDALVELYRNGHASFQGKQYPLHYLPRLLGDAERTPESKPYNAILLLRSGEQRIALHLDELQGNKEVVIKNLGEQLSRVNGIAGATVQADGRVVLILNPIPLTQQMIQTGRMAARTAAAETTVRRIPTVMIVDDSLTVRKITSRLLSRVGYEVVTAKDGVDALEQLVDVMPDVMLLDVEMPRMDGFELTKQLRRDPKTEHLPIIMITSRTADKHRTYALEMGVNEYLGKPYQDEELLQHLARFAPLVEAATT